MKRGLCISRHSFYTCAASDTQRGLSHCVTSVLLHHAPTSANRVCSGMGGRKKSKPKAMAPPLAPHRTRKSRDTPDPSLVIEGRRERKPVPRVDASPEGQKVKAPAVKPGPPPPPKPKPRPKPILAMPPVVESDSDHEDVELTPPPLTNKDTLYVSMGEEEEEEEEEEPPKKAVAPPKGSKKKKAVDEEKEALKGKLKRSMLLHYLYQLSTDTMVGIRFCIPMRNTAGQEHSSYLNIAIGETAAFVLQEVYRIIGCESLHPNSLPTVLYHLSKDLKSRKFELNSAGWDELQREWNTEVDKKGTDSLTDLTLPPDVSLHLVYSVLQLTLCSFSGTWRQPKNTRRAKWPSKRTPKVAAGQCPARSYSSRTRTMRRRAAVRLTWTAMANTTPNMSERGELWKLS